MLSCHRSLQNLCFATRPCKNIRVTRGKVRPGRTSDSRLDRSISRLLTWTGAVSTALPAKPGARSIVESAFRAARHRLQRRAAVLAEFQSLGIFGSAMSTVISPSRSTTHFVEQRAGVLEIGSIEPFGEPAVDLGEHRACLVATTLFVEQLCEAHRRAQLPGLRAHIFGE